MLKHFLSLNISEPNLGLNLDGLLYEFSTTWATLKFLSCWKRLNWLKRFDISKIKILPGPSCWMSWFKVTEDCNEDTIFIFVRYLHRRWSVIRTVKQSVAAHQTERNLSLTSVTVGLTYNWRDFYWKSSLIYLIPSYTSTPRLANSHQSPSMWRTSQYEWRSPVHQNGLRPRHQIPGGGKSFIIVPTNLEIKKLLSIHFYYVQTTKCHTES